MFTEWTLSEKLLENMPCSLPHVSLRGAAPGVTSLLLCPSLLLPRKGAVIFLAGWRADPLSSLESHLCSSFTEQIVVRTQVPDPQAKVTEQVCTRLLSLWHRGHMSLIEATTSIFPFFWSIAHFFLQSLWQISESTSTVSRGRKESYLLSPLLQPDKGKAAFWGDA